MTETTSRVYDLTHPSCSTLKDISAIALVVELWREELEIARTENETSSLTEGIPLKKIIPNLPPLIYELLDEYIAKFRSSITLWLAYHFHRVLHVRYNCDNEMLNNFSDFVWDWNGAIHYVRTAKRMMLCDRLSDDEKFKIACFYCFEDDIRRIWPSVCSTMNVIEMQYRYPLLGYWVFNLRDELHNVPCSSDEALDEAMLKKCEYHNFSSAEYFWNRLPYERRSRAAISVSMSDFELFARFILPKLDDFQLGIFLAERAVDFMISLLIHSREKAHVLPTWMYIKNKMNESNFIRLIEELLKVETNERLNSKDAEERLSPNDEVYLCCEMWKHSPENLKRLTLKEVLLNEELFNRTDRGPSDPREMRFLITLLSDAGFELRHEFWCKNWRNLISGARVEDLRTVMKLCSRDENDMRLFKEQHMCKYENIGPYCSHLLEYGRFKELNEFLFFCYSDELKRTELKQQLLRSNFLYDYISHFRVRHNHAELNEFIEDAFENADLRAEFKYQFVSQTVTEYRLLECSRLGYFGSLLKFVETFDPNERAVTVSTKQRLIDDFKERLIDGRVWQKDGDNLQNILVWLLGNESEVNRFKRSLSVSEIFSNMIEEDLQSHRGRCDADFDNSPLEYPVRLNDFLMWYFNDIKKAEKFKQRFSDKLKVFSGDVALTIQNKNESDSKCAIL